MALSANSRRVGPLIMSLFRLRRTPPVCVFFRFRPIVLNLAVTYLSNISNSNISSASCTWVTFCMCTTTAMSWLCQAWTVWSKSDPSLCIERSLFILAIARLRNYSSSMQFNIHFCHNFSEFESRVSCAPTLYITHPNYSSSFNTVHQVHGRIPQPVLIRMWMPGQERGGGPDERYNKGTQYHPLSPFGPRMTMVFKNLALSFWISVA